MVVKFSRGRYFVMRETNVIPAIGSRIQWRDVTYQVTGIDYNLNVTPGQDAPGQLAATVHVS